MEFLRDEYLDLLTFRSASRPMFVELFGPLIGLEDEWRAQGATEEEIALTAFDWDYVRVVGCPAATGPIGGKQTVTLEDTAEHLIQTDSLGRTVKLCKGKATIPLPLDFPVKDMDSWLAIKHMFQFRPERIGGDRIAATRRARDAGALVVAGMPGGFDMPRELMGEAVACMSYYDQPELMNDILETMGDTAFRTLELVTRDLQVDQLSVHEDLAGKSPLIGPRQVSEFIAPYYRRIWDMMASRGCRLFQQDSDGNITALIEPFLEAGVNCFFPMEPAAGMDMVEMRRKHGRSFATLGGIDKHVLREGSEAIRRELEYKLQPLMQEGGAVFGLDHRIPNGTPIEAYRYYVDLGRELLGLPPRDGSRQGWQRMAF